MELKIERVNSANATIEATLLQNDIEKKVEKIAKDAAKNMKIDGFRKGRVPLSVIKRRYSDKLIQDAEGEAFRELVDRALKDLEILNEDLIGEPQITKFDKLDGGEIDVEFKLGIKPTIEVESYEELIPEVEEVEITEEEVDERLKDLAKAQAPLKKVEEDRELKEGDYAKIDFEGFVDSEPLEGGKAENYSLEIGSKSFIEGFEEQLIGMRVNDEKEVNVSFPESYHKRELANKPANFKVKLKEIEAKDEVQIDDELAKKMLPGEESPTVDMLKDKIREQIKSEKMTNLYNNELKPKLIDKLIEAFEFDLPDFVVEQEIDLAFRNRLQTMKEDEVNSLKDDKDRAKEIREELRDDAKKSVKITFIIDTLAKKEDIDVSENEMFQTIYYEAMQMGQNPQQLVEMYQNQGLLPAIKMAMIEDKLLSKLLDRKLKK